MNDTVEKRRTTVDENGLSRTEFYYAQYKNNKYDSRMFLSTEGRIFYIRKDFCNKYVTDKDRGQYFWIMRNGTYTAIAVPNHTKQEAAIFTRKFKPGDIICCPFIKHVGDEYRVSVYPSLYGLIDETECDEDLTKLIPGKIYRFEIKTMETDEFKRLNVTLKFAGAYDETANRFYEQIPTPDEIARTVFVVKEQEDIFTDRTRFPEGTFESIMGKKSLTAEDYTNYILDKYREQYDNRTLVIHQGKKGTQIDVDLAVKDINGVPVKAGINARPDNPRLFFLALIGCVDPGSEMERHVYIPDINEMTRQLWLMALPENWDDGTDDEQPEKRHVLAQYIRHTFYKCMLDGLIEINDEGNAIFNTGLVNRTYDDIYCYLKVNTDLNDAFKRRWIFAGFAFAGSDGIGKEITASFAKYPEPPKYIDPQHPENIILDTTKQIFIDYDHIIEDNISRFPTEYLERTFMNTPGLSKIISDKEDYGDPKSYRKGLNEAISADRTGEYHGRIKLDVENAVKLAVKSCRFDYKTAVPVFYSRTNRLSLLLPIRLDPFSEKADLALVVDKLPNGNYQGQTILTIPMAYLDARLICRPGERWLYSSEQN